MKPALRKSIDFTGTPGEILSAVPYDLDFSPQRYRTSPYAPLLQQLRDKGNGHVLKFASPKARVSVTKCAKKLGLKLLFAFKDGAMFVKLAETDTSAADSAADSAAGKTPAPPPPAPAADSKCEAQSAQPRNAELILEALKAGRDTVFSIAMSAKTKNPNITPTTVEAILGNLLRSKVVKLKDRPKATGEERWMLA